VDFRFSPTLSERHRHCPNGCKHWRHNRKVLREINLIEPLNCSPKLFLEPEKFLAANVRDGNRRKFRRKHGTHHSQALLRFVVPFLLDQPTRRFGQKQEPNELYERRHCRKAQHEPGRENTRKTHLTKEIIVHAPTRPSCAEAARSACTTNGKWAKFDCCGDACLRGVQCCAALHCNSKLLNFDSIKSFFCQNACVFVYFFSCELFPLFRVLNNTYCNVS